jgi:hypothetical protein
VGGYQFLTIHKRPVRVRVDLRAKPEAIRSASNREKKFYEEARIFHISGAVGYRRRDRADKHNDAVDNGPEHILVQYIDGDTEQHYRSDCNAKHHNSEHNRPNGFT